VPKLKIGSKACQHGTVVGVSLNRILLQTKTNIPSNLQGKPFFIKHVLKRALTPYRVADDLVPNFFNP